MSAAVHALTVEVETERWSGRVLDGVDLSVPRGHLAALLGGPGAGKTMVARALVGRLPAAARTTGTVEVDGRIGYLPQDGIEAFAPDEPVGTQLRRLGERHQALTVEQACMTARCDADALGLLPGQHSAGQIQRAALAAALLTDPEVLVADAPTASLDVASGAGVWRGLRLLADAGAAVLVITHDVRTLAESGIADDVIILSRGRVLASGTVRELAASADPWVRMFFA